MCSAKATGNRVINRSRTAALSVAKTSTELLE